MAQTRRGMGQAAKWLAVAVGVLVAAVVALALALDSDAISGRVKAVVVPRASEALGRELTVTDARLSIFPNPRVRLGGAQLAGRAGEPPLARLESLDVEIGLWPLVRSLGKEVRVHGLTLVRPEVNLVRGRDGRWNYEGLGGPSDAPAEERAPSGEPVRFAVEKATLTDGTLRFIDLTQGRDDQAVALTKMDLTASGGPGAPVSLTFSAALAAAEKNLELSLDSPLLPEDLAEGGWPALTGRVALKGLQLAQLRGFFPADLAAIARGGKVDLSADVKSQGGGYRLAGKGAIEDLRLHGEPASGGFTLTGAARPAGPAHLAVTDLAVKGPGIELGGSAELQTEPIRARFAISGPLLDLGAVLGLAPADPSKKPEPLPKGTLLPPAMQEQVAAVAVDGTLDIQKVVNGKLTATDVKASARLAKGVLTLERASAKLYGGAVEASGTQVHLTEANPRWNLKARLDGVDLGGAMEAITGAAPLTGRLTGTIDLAGAGADWEHVKRALTGRGALALAGGALTTTDLGDAALAAVSNALSRVGQAGAAEKLSGLEDGKTTLDDLAASFDVKDGFLALTRPLAFRSPAGEARLGGRVGLSQELALEGTLALSKELLARAGAGGLLSSGVGVPLRLGGTLTSPSVSIAAEEAVAGAARGAAKKVVAEKREQVEGEVKERVEEKARGILDRLGK